MLNIHQGACPIMMWKKSYSVSLFSVLICFSSKIYVYWNAGCDNHMINFANEDFELPDKLDGNVLTLRRLMSYIYGAPILDVSRSHTTTQHSR